MLFDPNGISLIFLLTAVANAFLGFLMTRRTGVPGHEYFARFAYAFAIWAFAVFLETAVLDPEWKIFFSKCSYFGVTTAVVFQFLFGLRFSGRESVQSVRRWYLLFAVSGVFIGLGFTNEWHYLQWSAYEVHRNGLGLFVRYVPGPGVWVLAFFMWALFVAGMWLIARRLMIGHALYRHRFFALLAVFLTPLAGNVAYMFRLLPYPEIDWSPQLFSIAFAGLYIIMQRNQLLETLPESRETVFQALRDPVLVFNTEGRLVDINPAGVREWPGLAAGLGRPPADLAFPAGWVEPEAGNGIEMELTGASGPRWYQVSVSGIRSAGDVRGRMILCHDITAARQARAAIEESERQLRALNASKDRFFSIIGHDLRAPFAMISGLAAHLASNLQHQSPASLADNLRMMESTTVRALDLLENLLTWARLQTGEMKAGKKVLNMRRTADHALALYENQAARKQVTLSCSISEQCVGFFDENMVLTVLRNLISNAIKFSPAGGTVQVSGWCDAEGSIFEVSDAGTGIPPELKDRLFSMDDRVTRPGTAGETGTGLGLLLCTEFAALHGGRMEVESLAPGTRFRLVLPGMW